MKYYMRLLLFKCILFGILLISINSYKFRSMPIKCLRSYAGDCTMFWACHPEIAEVTVRGMSLSLCSVLPPLVTAISHTR